MFVSGVKNKGFQNKKFVSVVKNIVKNKGFGSVCFEIQKL